ncbi:hypothetical protein, partial [Enterococcus faecium]|uniref:hypothetical protein n=1 Tax=Enterococcus faecium TaxID=1352 RepID=UPI002930C0D3
KVSTSLLIIFQRDQLDFCCFAAKPFLRDACFDLLVLCNGNVSCMPSRLSILRSFDVLLIPIINPIFYL